MKTKKEILNHNVKRQADFFKRFTDNGGKVSLFINIFGEKNYYKAYQRIGKICPFTFDNFLNSMVKVKKVELSKIDIIVDNAIIGFLSKMDTKIVYSINKKWDKFYRLQKYRRELFFQKKKLPVLGKKGGKNHVRKEKEESIKITNWSIKNLLASK